MKKTIPPT